MERGRVLNQRRILGEIRAKQTHNSKWGTAAFFMSGHFFGLLEVQQVKTTLHIAHFAHLQLINLE